jgi:hypothetical protein
VQEYIDTQNPKDEPPAQLLKENREMMADLQAAATEDESDDIPAVIQSHNATATAVVPSTTEEPRLIVTVDPPQRHRIESSDEEAPAPPQNRRPSAQDPAIQQTLEKYIQEARRASLTRQTEQQLNDIVRQKLQERQEERDASEQREKERQKRLQQEERDKQEMARLRARLERGAQDDFDMDASRDRGVSTMSTASFNNAVEEIENITRDTSVAPEPADDDDDGFFEQDTRGRARTAQLPATGPPSAAARRGPALPSVSEDAGHATRATSQSVPVAPVGHQPAGSAAAPTPLVVETMVLKADMEDFVNDTTHRWSTPEPPPPPARAAAASKSHKLSVVSEDEQPPQS